MTAARGTAGLRLGVVLPSFRSSAAPALEAARAAAGIGLHGVFAYDHLWPMGQPGRPAISPYPLLGAVAVRQPTIVLGTLVARVGLVRPEVLTGELETLAALAPARCVFALGTGDHLSAAENRAFGLEYAPAPARRAMLASVARALAAAGIEVWVGGGAPATNRLCRELGATLNLWNPSRAHLAEELASGPVSWGGNLPTDAAEAAALLAHLAEVGVTWAVCNWPGDLERLAAAAAAAGVALGEAASTGGGRHG